jgi:phosphatidylserine/phosphatidylglycerophosphate/cardiolipin synthase-like enzyme
VVSPENSRQWITRMIDEAEISIAFYAEVIRDDQIVEALGSAVDRGVGVRLIVNATVDPQDLELLVDLSRDGVEVRMMESLYIHSKTMIFDSASALIGSHNYTMTSLDRNRELGIVIRDERPVSRVVAVYERDWLRAIPAEPVTFVSPFRITLAGIGMAPAGTGYRATLVISHGGPILRLKLLQSPAVLVTE